MIEKIALFSLLIIFSLIFRLYFPIKFQIAPIWFSIFFKKNSVFLTSLEMHCPSVMTWKGLYPIVELSRGVYAMTVKLVGAGSNEYRVI